MAKKNGKSGNGKKKTELNEFEKWALEELEKFRIEVDSVTTGIQKRTYHHPRFYSDGMADSFRHLWDKLCVLQEKFGKIMSIPDNLILPYFLSFADVNEEEVKDLDSFIKENPLEAKKQLGSFLIALETGGITEGNIEREDFERKFSKKNITEEDVTILKGKKGDSVFDLVVSSKTFKSISAVRKLFEQGAVSSISGVTKKLSVDAIAGDGEKIQVGKRNFFQISLE